MPTHLETLQDLRLHSDDLPLCLGRPQPVRLLPPLMLVLLAVLLLSALAGCNSQQAAAPGADAVSGIPQTLDSSRSAAPAQTPAPGGLALPPPAELIAAFGPGAPTAPTTATAMRRASYVPADLILQGEAFAPALPAQRVTAEATAATFAPVFDGAGGSFEELAFAMYSFLIPQYTGDASVRLDWQTPPADGDCYVALANWGENRWEVFAAQSVDQLTLASLDEYFVFNGGLLAAVIVTGEANAVLDSLRIGSPPPVPVLDVAPSGGLFPFTANFDASASSDPDNAIAEYRWDPQGDGSFEISTGATPQLAHEYAEGGTFQAGLRVIDASGVFADTSIEVTALDSLAFSFGTAGAHEYGKVLMPCDDGDLLMLGNFETIDPFKTRIIAARFPLGGEPRFIKSWSGNGREEVFGAVRGPDGFVYSCGDSTTYGTSYDGLLQKWSEDGELIWSKAVGTADWGEVFSGIVLGSDSLYVCGRMHAYSIAKTLGLVLRFDLDGNLIWVNALEITADTEVEDIVYTPGMVIGDPAVRVCGDQFVTGGDNDVFYADFDADGGLLSASTWGAPAAYEEALALSTVGAIIKSNYVLIKGPAPTTCIFSKVSGGSVALNAADMVVEPGDLQGLSLALRVRPGAINFFGSVFTKMDSSLNPLEERLFADRPAAPTVQPAWAFMTALLS